MEEEDDSVSCAGRLDGFDRRWTLFSEIGSGDSLRILETRRGDTPIRPSPWQDHGKRFAFSHGRFMGIGGDGVRRSLNCLTR